MVEKMRKGLRVLSAAILSSLAGAVLHSCAVKESVQEITEAAEGDEVILSVSFSVPAMEHTQTLQTKAHGFGRQRIETLWLVLFDKNGYFEEAAKVYDLSQTAPSYEGQGLPDSNLDNKWQVNGKVKIHASADTLVAHLIANYDCSTLGFDSEQEIINKMVTRFTGKAEYFGSLMRISQGTQGGGYGAPEAYWQRVELPGGLPGDAAKLRRVPLVRNMCRIKVTNADPDFKMLGYMVVNVPDRGTVAPFNVVDGLYQPFAFAESTNPNTNGVETYTNYDYTKITDSHHYHGYSPVDVNMLSPNHYAGGARGWTSDLEIYYGYQPFFQSVYVRGTSNSGTYHTIPSGYYPSADTSVKTYSSWNEITEAPEEPFYMYEAPYTADPDTYTYLIIRGRRREETRYSLGSNYYYDYYKVDLVRNIDGRTEYYNLLRNFEYEVQIYDVSGEGYRTAGEASTHIASNNINASILAHDLRNVSDGGSRLFVSDVDFVRTSASKVEFYYKYVPDIYSPDVTDNVIGSGHDLQISYGDGVVFPSDSVTIAASDVASGTYKGWRKVTVSLPVNTGLEKQQTLTLYTTKTVNVSGTDYQVTRLQRDILFRTRQPYDFSVCFLDSGSEVSTVSVADTLGAPVTMRVRMPSALPSYIFPLQVGFSVAENSLSPASGSKLYTEMIASMSGSGKGIYFVRTLGYDEFQGLTEDGSWRYFDASFVTSAASSASDMTVGNAYYFTPATVSFTNP